MMSREDKLFSMTMACLVEVADKLGIKIDKKGAKAKAVAKILAAEAERDAKEADSLEISNAIVADFERDDDTCADGTAYVEIGKEIAEEAKAKAKKAKIEKKAKKEEKPAKNAVNVKETLIGILDECNAEYRVSSKRIILYDNKVPVAILLLNKASVTAVIKDVCLSDALDDYYKEFNDVRYSKSGYNKCLGVNADAFEEVIPKLIFKKEA